MFGYLKGTIGKGIFYKKDSNVEVIRCSDAYGTGSKYGTRLISGHCIFVGENLVTRGGICNCSSLVKC